MKAEIEVEFKTPEHASKALKIVKTKELSDKAKVSLAAKGSKFLASVEAKNYSALRARVTSLMRDLKVVFDAIGLVESKNKR